jgi:hypothetical protein
MDAVVCGRGALSLLFLILLPALESSSGIEHPAEQPLLPFDGATLQPPPFQSAGKLGSLLGHVPRSGNASRTPQFLQLLSKSTLLGRQPLELFADCAAPGHRQQAGTLLAQATLLPSELREPLQGLRQSGPGLRA